MMNRLYCTIATLLLCASVTPASDAAAWHKQHETVMGTRVTVDLQAESGEQAERCSNQVFDEMRRIDRTMSPYIETSELYKVNRGAATAPVRISDELFRIIARSLDISRASGGAFDITFASVGYLYNYRNKQRPSDDDIGNRLDAIDYNHVKMDPDQRTIRFTHENVRIDLGGIAKGYAVDNAIVILKRCGIANALVSAGGDSRVIGNRDGYEWVIGVRHPRDRDKVAVRIPLLDTAISTSGDYERFFIEGTERHHHIINPGTGKSVAGTWSATVLGTDAMTTDALSTTLFVLGADKALEFIETFDGIDAIIIDNQGKMHYSSGLMPPAPTDSASLH